MGSIEAGLIFALRVGESRDVLWPITLMAVLSAVLLSAGVLRHYWDIYVHRTVRGISFMFVGIDAMGDLTSLLSLLFQPKLDTLGVVIYGSELVLWIGVFVAGGYFNLLPWSRRRLERLRSQHAARGIGLSRDASENVGDGVVNSHGIALHDIPSSTSVFRTPSGNMTIARARSGGMGRTQSGNED